MQPYGQPNNKQTRERKWEKERETPTTLVQGYMGNQITSKQEREKEREKEREREREDCAPRLPLRDYVS